MYNVIRKIIASKKQNRNYSLLIHFVVMGIVFISSWILGDNSLLSIRFLGVAYLFLCINFLIFKNQRQHIFYWPIFIQSFVFMTLELSEKSMNYFLLLYLMDVVLSIVLMSKQNIEELEIDESALLKKLESIPPKSKVAFACSCAERLYPLYKNNDNKTDANPILLRETLDLLWADIIDETHSEEELDRLIKGLESMVFDDAGDDLAEHIAYAEIAWAAVYYSLKCRFDGDSQNAVWASLQVYEAINYYVRVGQSSNNKFKSNERAMKHPFIQKEIEYQSRDIIALVDSKREPEEIYKLLLKRTKDEKWDFLQ